MALTNSRARVLQRVIRGVLAFTDYLKINMVADLLLRVADMSATIGAARRVLGHGAGACSMSWASSWAMRRSAKRTLERAACSCSPRVRLPFVSSRTLCLSVVFSVVIR